MEVAGTHQGSLHLDNPEDLLLGNHDNQVVPVEAFHSLVEACLAKRDPNLRKGVETR